MIILGIIATCSFLQAQSPTELIALQQQKLTYIYAQEYGNMGQLIHGKVYQAYFPSAKGDPFWLSADWTIGSLQTHHVYYPELPLKYDAYLDALVFAVDLVNPTFIRVNELQVKSFWIQQRQFDYLGSGTEKAAMKDVNLIPGYFELIYEGKSKLYAKREKRFEKYQDDYEHVGEFSEKSTYLLLKNQVFWIVKGKKDWLQFSQDHEAEMEQYLKQQGIRFRNISDTQWVQLIDYYESL